MTTPPPVHGRGLIARGRDSEPVRLYVYGVIVPALALLVGYGVLSASTAALWAALGAAVLAVPTVAAAETARTVTYSPESTLRLLAGLGPNRPRAGR